MNVVQREGGGEGRFVVLAWVLGVCLLLHMPLLPSVQRPRWHIYLIRCCKLASLFHL